MTPIDQTQKLDLPVHQEVDSETSREPDSGKIQEPEWNEKTDTGADSDEYRKASLREYQESEPEENAAPAALHPNKQYAPAPDSPVSDWFFTLMCIHIPIAGWIYLICLAFRKERTQRRNFARAYLFYRLLFLIISVILLGIVVYICLDMVDQLLAYMEML